MWYVSWRVPKSSNAVASPRRADAEASKPCDSQCGVGLKNVHCAVARYAHEELYRLNDLATNGRIP